MHRVLGVDPGNSGYLACIGQNNTVQTIRMPTKKVIVNRKEKNKIDPIFLTNAIRELNPSVAVVEDVYSSPQMGVTSAFTFGEGKGMLAGVLAALGVPVVWVPPATWKRALSLSADKTLSKTLVKKLFPAHKCKTIDEAEALLLAYYGVQLLLTAAKRR